MNDQASMSPGTKLEPSIQHEDTRQRTSKTLGLAFFPIKIGVLSVMLLVDIYSCTLDKLDMSLWLHTN